MFRVSVESGETPLSCKLKQLNKFISIVGAHFVNRAMYEAPL